MSAQTTEIAERAATIPSALALGETALIGVFGTPDARRALVRTGRGRVSRIAVGDRLLGGRVSRIEADRVVIETAHGPAELSLPGMP